MKSYDYEMWDVVMDGLYASMKTQRWSEDMEPKPWSEWIDIEVKKIQINFKVINILHSALNLMKFNKISTYKLAKEIKDKLRVTHEGTKNSLR